MGSFSRVEKLEEMMLLREALSGRGKSVDALEGNSGRKNRVD
jgi:hypothetical protein